MRDDQEIFDVFENILFYKTCEKYSDIRFGLVTANCLGIVLRMMVGQ